MSIIVPDSPVDFSCDGNFLNIHELVSNTIGKVGKLFS